MSQSSLAPQKTLYALVTFCFVVLVFLLFISGHGKAQENRKGLPAVTVEASELQWQEQYEKIQRVVGRVESSQNAKMGFELGGLVNRVFVDDGAVVTKGQTLASIDTQLLESELSQARATLARVETQVSLARSSFNRIKGLVRSNVESQQRLDEAQQTLDSAVASAKEAKARINSIEVNLEKSTLTAPFDGEVVSRLVDIGNVVSAGQPIFEVVSSGSKEARIPMPDNLVEQLSVGQEYMLRNDLQPFKAILKSVGKQRRMATRTIDAVFSLDPTQPQVLDLLPGDLLTLDVKIEVKETGAWIPVGALSHGLRGLWNIYSVEQGDTNNVVARAVEVLYTDGQFAFVRGAIRPDMVIVTSGTHRLAPGQEVAVKIVPQPDIAQRELK